MHLSNDQNEMIMEIAKLILTNKKKMVKEEDLIRLYDKSTSDFDETFKNLYEQFNKLGFELIKAEFQGKNYYVLTSEGKDDNITPSQYGSLALIAALSKEVNENFSWNRLDDHIDHYLKLSFILGSNSKDTEVLLGIT